MATKYWLGIAEAVAQIENGSVDSVDGTPNNNQFIVTIGGVTVQVPGNTDINTTAGDLQVALAASTHPYFSNITWTNPTGSTITATAATAGVPFTATLTVSGAGTGTVTTFANNTPSAGPCHWDTVGNWDGGVLPVATDDIIIADSAVNICYGIEPSVDLTTLNIPKTYTGKLGLPRNVFTTSADGDTNVTTATEYRPRYLKTGFDTCNAGADSGIGAPVGSSRIKLDNDKAGGSTFSVLGTNAAADGNLPAVQYKAAHASANVFIRDALGGFGIAVDAPGETSTVGNINCSAGDTQTRIQIGPGVTLTNFTQDGGDNFLKAAATITKIESNGGELITEGAYAVTTLEMNGGIVTSNATGAIAACNLKGGTLDMLGSNEARTITVLNPDGGTIRLDDDVVTVGTWNEPSGRKSVTTVPAA